MRIGTKNEDAILAAFCNYNIVTDLFQCRLLESNKVPWLAASPDAMTIVKNPNGQKVLGTIEVKTRVSPEHAAEVERIASHWNNKMIVCIVGNDNIKEIMDKEHAMQVTIQMATCHLNWAIYIVKQPRTTKTHGQILYTVILYALEDVIGEFMSSTMNMFDMVLSPFYIATNFDDLQEHLPDT
jgi:hypothetical protein